MSDSADIRASELQRGGQTTDQAPPVRPIKRIGFVSTRISGTDGVSLEVGKWTEILEAMGYDCFFIAGECDRDPQKSYLIDEADFNHPLIREINRKCFGRRHRIRQMSELIQSTAKTIKAGLYEAFDQFDLDVVIAQNVLTIPMNIPLGAALLETLLERQLDCVAHHHDFVWERDRFLINGVEDYIAAFFPPRFGSIIEHVVINSLAGAEFSRRTGLPCRLIPNIMNFDDPPAPMDDYASDFRETIGVKPDEILILQPTRVVQRKGIEHSIELARRLDRGKCKLVITHGYDDEGLEAYERVKSFAELIGVEVVFAAHWISHRRGLAEDGTKLYSVADAYQHAEMIAYPSLYEGFGNAFLEAIYFKKPILCNRYTIFQTDIEPYGFQTITMDGYISQKVVEDVQRVLDDEQYRQQMVEHNYRVAQQNFSYARAAKELESILSNLRPVCNC